MSFEPNVTQGRGAWTARGKANGSKYYVYLAGRSLDGGDKNPDHNQEAVHYAVLTIQKALGMLAEDADGVWGRQTDAYAKKWQTANGLTANGQLSSTHLKILVRPYLTVAASTFAVPAAHLWGLAQQESTFDPGAVGYTSPADQGLFQINLSVHDVSLEQAHDLDFAARWAAEELAEARARFAGEDEDLRTRCAILNHNSPANARKLFNTGEYPTAQARDYVTKVLEYAKGY